MTKSFQSDDGSEPTTIRIADELVSRIEECLSEYGRDLGAVIARMCFRGMRRCGDEVQELLHDGRRVECVGGIPFAYFSAFRSRLNVGFSRYNAT